MKILVSIDGEGHFTASHQTDRPATLNLLKSINNGDYFNDIVKVNNIKIKEDLTKHCCREWDKIVKLFIQKGFVEYVDISDTAPLNCLCILKK